MRPKPLKPIRTDPKVEVVLKARPDKSWFWQVKVYASNRASMGVHWNERISRANVNGSPSDIERHIGITAGAIAEHQQASGSVFEPSEIANLAIAAYRDLVKQLERDHGGAIPAMGLRQDGTV